MQARCLRSRKTAIHIIAGRMPALQKESARIKAGTLFIFGVTN